MSSSSAATPGHIVCFGEALMRLDTPGYERFLQATQLQMSFTGGESNVAIALAQWGLASKFVSRVPRHDLGEACLNHYRRYGVDVSSMARGGDRLGIFFVENGRSQRGPRVIYDRAGSAFRQLSPGDFDWPAILAGASWFHVSGTAPALGEPVRYALAKAIEYCNSLQIPVSLDVSYRSALWTIDEARSVLAPLLERVDVLIGSEQDARQFFGVTSDGEVSQRDLLRKYDLRAVVYSDRQVTEAGLHRYQASLLVGDELVSTPVHEIDVVDRIGTGDALTAGVIRGLVLGHSPAETLAFGMAAAVLKHSIPGDFALLSVSEVETLACGGSLSKVRR